MIGQPFILFRGCFLYEVVIPRFAILLLLPASPPTSLLSPFLPDSLLPCSLLPTSLHASLLPAALVLASLLSVSLFPFSFSTLLFPPDSFFFLSCFFFSLLLRSTSPPGFFSLLSSLHYPPFFASSSRLLLFLFSLFVQSSHAGRSEAEMKLHPSSVRGSSVQVNAILSINRFTIRINIS